MVARGNGTDGWHRELADSWRLKTLFFWGVAEDSRQIRSSESEKMTASPFPSASKCQGGSSHGEKGHKTRFS